MMEDIPGRTDAALIKRITGKTRNRAALGSFLTTRRHYSP